MTAMVVLLASARARPLDDDPMVASGFCATHIGLLLALVNQRAAKMQTRRTAKPRPGSAAA